MGRKKKAGRPEMPEKDRKIGFSIKVNPKLWTRIKPLINRSRQIEEVLEKNF